MSHSSEATTATASPPARAADDAATTEQSAASPNLVTSPDAGQPPEDAGAPQGQVDGPVGEEPKPEPQRPASAGPGAQAPPQASASPASAEAGVESVQTSPAPLPAAEATPSTTESTPQPVEEPAAVTVEEASPSAPVEAGPSSAAPVAAKTLQEVFTAFSSFGGASPTEMGNSQLAKLVREAGLLDKVLTMTDVDLIFNKAKPKGKRWVTYDVFRDTVVPSFAKKKGLTAEQVAQKIIDTGGPKAVGTVGEAPKLSDEKPKEKRASVDASAAAATATPEPTAPRETAGDAPAKREGTSPPPERKLTKLTSILKSNGPFVQPPAVDGELGEKLQQMFTAFSSFGGASPTDMGNSQLAKLVREAELVDKYFTMTDVDIIFNKTKPKGKRTVTYPQFRDAIVVDFAKKKGLTNEQVAQKIIDTGGPKANNASQALDVRFYNAPPAAGTARTVQPLNAEQLGAHNDAFAAAAASAATAEQPPTAFPLLAAALVGQSRTGLLGALMTAAGLGQRQPGVSRNPAAGGGDESPSMLRRTNSAGGSSAYSASGGVGGSFSSPGRRSLTAEEAHRLIHQHAAEVREMKKARARKENAKIEAERAEIEAAAAARRAELEEQRRQREQALQERLDKLRQRREARELEFLVGERRAHQVLQSRNLVDDIEERYQRRLQAEEEERERLLRDRRDKMRQPLWVGLEDVEAQRRALAEQVRRRGEELRKHMLEVERSTQPPRHQGRSYELAQDEFIRARAKIEDEKHQRLYKHVKMVEYGKLVAQLPPVPLPPVHHHHNNANDNGAGGHDHAAGASRSPPPPSHQQQPQPGPLQHAPVQPRSSLSVAERTKAGNDYLRSALKDKTPLPPGLRLQPIETAEAKDEQRRRERKKKGDQYLRELQQQQCERDGSDGGGDEPHHHHHHHHHHHKSRLEVEEEEQRLLAEMRRLRHRATTIETTLASHSHSHTNAQSGGGSSGGGGDVVDTSEALEVEGELAMAEKYLDVVTTKMELLKRVEIMRKGRKKGHQV